MIPQAKHNLLCTRYLLLLLPGKDCYCLGLTAIAWDYYLLLLLIVAVVFHGTLEPPSFLDPGLIFGTDTWITRTGTLMTSAVELMQLGAAVNSSVCR